MNTKTVRTTQGIQAMKASPGECFLMTAWAFLALLREAPDRAWAART